MINHKLYFYIKIYCNNIWGHKNFVIIFFEQPIQVCRNIIFKHITKG
jgi:hypothetical protein